MKKTISLWAVFFWLFLGFFLTNAQTPTRTPPEESAAFIKEKLRANSVVNTIEGVLNPDLQNSRLIRLPRTSRVIIFPNKRDKELTSVDDADKSKYSAFLKGSNTGILRLHDSENCDEDGKTISADEPCPWNIVGKATLFSFRKKDYSSKLFSDLEFENKEFKVVGLNLLGFLANLGEVSLDNLNLQSKGIKELVEFQPSTDVTEIKKQFIVTKNGFRVGDYFYKNELKMNPDQSYVLRSIAYDSKVYWKIGSRKINILAEDKRKDVIIIFRVVRQNNDGSIVLLWKKLQQKSAPEIISEDKK